MSLNSSDPAPKRKSPIARWLLAFTILAICAVLFLGQKHKEMVLTCNGVDATPQEALQACDFLLTWTAKEPSTRSLLHRHKLRAFIREQKLDDALVQADLAIAEDPESPVPWQWKATVFIKSENYLDALTAIDQSLVVDPDNKYSLRTKYKLLTELELYEVIDELVSQDWAKGKIAVLLPGDSVKEVTWNPSRFPKSHAAFLKITLKLRDDLVDDLHNSEYRWRYGYHCMLLAENCPPLLPDKRGSYPILECDDVIEDYSRERPVEVERILKNTEYQTLRDLIDSDTQLATRYISGEYISTFGGWFPLSDSQAIPSDLPRRLIQTHKLFDCVSGGEFIYFELSEEEKEDYEQIGIAPMEKEEFERLAEKQFNMAVRLNLLDLAHVYAN